MANPNFQLLVDAAKLLKPILGELVFVGGCTTALLITDKAAADVLNKFKAKLPSLLQVLAERNVRFIRLFPFPDQSQIRASIFCHQAKGCSFQPNR
jgi:hypothetical protein